MSDEEEVDGGGLSVDGQTKLRLSFSDHQPSTFNSQPRHCYSATS